MIASEEEARAYIDRRWGGEALKRCQRLVDALRAENERQNLVSRTTLPHVWLRHVADSAQLLELSGDGTSRWLDVGSGAGFPGLVVAALRPDIDMVLLEPRRKRVEWLHAMADALDLTRCRVVQAAAKAYRANPHPDVISARAVAELGELLAMTGHLRARDTVCLFPKGAGAEDELDRLTSDARARCVFHVKHSLTSPDARIIVVRGC